ncbi:hypothetical protein BHYA_0352g00050 [Botrytis hyacinthi]|uniref:Uncharacterized protein n=1 Tax=Botrytis hyacinthi TaxID=278943 RepID=A0A4Z1G519_9HELO|nr:hypothetical protein BHYA_0352g00050 [Botrytis hyacinthi]
MAAYTGKIAVLECYGTALCSASKCDRLEVVEELLNSGSGIFRNNEKWNALAVKVLKNLTVLMQYQQQA